MSPSVSIANATPGADIPSDLPRRTLFTRARSIARLEEPAQPEESGPQPTSSDTDGLLNWLRDVEPGEVLNWEGVTLIPLRRAAATYQPAYTLLAAAVNEHGVTIMEAQPPTVRRLRLHNLGELPVLILAGEEIVGGRQDRICASTMLAPPQCWSELHVACVEHYRWHAAADRFDVGNIAPPNVRRRLLERSRAKGAWPTRGRLLQSAVWREVADLQRRSRIHTRTGALRAVYAHLEGALQRAAAVLSYPDDGPVGVIALTAAGAICADVFDQPATLRHLWARLVRSYVIYALAVAASDDLTLGSSDLLQQAVEGVVTATPASGGVGRVCVTGRTMFGEGLVQDGVVLYLTLVGARPPAASEAVTPDAWSELDPWGSVPERSSAPRSRWET